MAKVLSGRATFKSPITSSSTGTTADGGWQRWWADESIRIGTNWQSIVALHFQICKVAFARACGAEAVFNVLVAASS